MWSELSQIKLTEMSQWLAAKSDPKNPDQWLPLWMHLIDTAGIMKLLTDNWLPEEVRSLIQEKIGSSNILSLSIFLGCTHDIGKATALFQSRILHSINDISHLLEKYELSILPDVRLYRSASETPHAIASEAILNKLNIQSDGTKAIISSHHGKPPRLDTNIHNQLGKFGYGKNYYGNESVSKKQWETIWQDYLAMAVSISGYTNEEQLPAVPMDIQVLLTGLLIMADWIASNTHYFPLISVDSCGSLTDYPQRISKAWYELGLPHAWEPPHENIDDSLFKERFNYLPNEIQRMVLQVVEASTDFGICILEAQMGVGKTEAALAAAEVLAKRNGAGGLFFGLPTQATSDGIFMRLEKWAQKQSTDVSIGIRLAHGMATLNENYQAIFHGTATVADDQLEGKLLVHPWFEGRKQALLSNFVIGTIDQLLMAALKQKHVMLRHLGLAGKVVIIDECHAYDAYMSQYLDMALTWLGAYHVPVIVLSATLPAKRREELIEAYLNRGKVEKGDWVKSRAYPLFTWTDGNEVFQHSVSADWTKQYVEIERITEEDLIDLLSHRLADGGCAAVIVNTVKRAQTFAKALQTAFPDFEVLVFHSGFLMPDRADKERNLVMRIGKDSSQRDRNKLIIVGTQVLEQSLDIDFDYLVTDLCPIDLLLQRMGRLHRHQRIRPQRVKNPKCAVFYSEDQEFESGAKMIYGEWLLSQTRDTLPSQIVLPDDIPHLVQKVYDPITDIETLDELSQEKYNRFTLKIRKQQNNAKQFRITRPGAEPTIYGWLDVPTDDNERQAEASVRDGISSIDVLLLIRAKDDSIHFVPWRETQEDDLFLSNLDLPSEQQCKKIASQRVHLPMHFCLGPLCGKVIDQLKNDRSFIEHWQQSHWLRDEMILFMGEDLTRNLCGYRLSYSLHEGLSYQKEDFVNE